MRSASLFSGIAGIDLGFERAGIETTVQVEIDEDCATLLSAKFPRAAHYADVRNVHAQELEVGGRPDVVCGGFPCQDLSVAGKRAGLAGDRSGLWFEFHRVLAEVRPRWVLIENVPGLYSSWSPTEPYPDAPRLDEQYGLDYSDDPRVVRGDDGVSLQWDVEEDSDLAVVIEGLVELGYGVAWRMLDAEYLGVAQRRERVFIVGCLGDVAGAAQVLFEPESCDWDTPPSRQKGQGAAATLGGGSGERGWPQDTDRMTFVPEASRALSGPNDPQAEDQASYVAEIAGALSIGQHNGIQPNGQDAYSGQLVSTALDTRNRDNPEHETFVVDQGGGKGMARVMDDAVGVAAPLSAGSNPNSNMAGRRREDDENIVIGFQPTAAEPATLDDLAPGVKVGSGLGIESPPAVAYVAHALSAEGSDASEDGTGRGTPLVADTLREHPRPGSNSVGALALSENQRAEVRLTEVSRQLTSGGGKPGQGYPAVAIRTAQTSSNGCGIDEEGSSYTLDETGGGAVAFTERSRAEGRNLETQDELAYALTNPGSGGRTHSRQIATKMAVRRLTPLECCRLQGFPDEWLDGICNVDAEEANAREILSGVRGAIGEEAFQEWGLGIALALRATEILRCDVHGSEFRPPSSTEHGMDDIALPRETSDPAWAVRAMRSAFCARCASQGWRLAEQLAREFGAVVSRMSLAGASQRKAVCALRWASQGTGLLQSALHPLPGRQACPNELSDSVRYRMLGNAVCTAVAYWIGRRMRAVDEGRDPNADRIDLKAYIRGLNP